MSKLKMLVVAASLVSAAPLVSAAGLLNGSFTAGLSNWLVTGPVETLAPFDYNGLCCNSVYGSYSDGLTAFFGGGGDDFGSISQEFDTVQGQTYKVSFDYGAIVNANTQLMLAQVIPTFNPSPITSLIVSAVGSMNVDKEQLVSARSFTFEASSARTTLQFLNISDPGVSAATDGVLDNVSVSVVPEPESLALMLAGLSVLGFLGRRRRRG